MEKTTTYKIGGTTSATVNGRVLQSHVEVSAAGIGKVRLVLWPVGAEIVIPRNMLATAIEGTA